MELDQELELKKMELNSDLLINPINPTGYHLNNYYPAGDLLHVSFP